ncbi:methyltransferase, FkbM family [Actinopolyspora lacussalsi subsp. righensis]|uniref:Methyltransferase, FkbM family n=2 Tax=Actinopolyspora righensis TaxID=995060 RepID=A0A1I6Z160_9ACTN|nr:methyltransferase, FkbM family [Actinopolyspora righensis]
MNHDSNFFAADPPTSKYDSTPGRRLSSLAATLRGAASISMAEPEVRGLTQLVGTGDTCFDIGAAYGMYSFPLAQLVGTRGAVHSFEPQPKPYSVLAAGRFITKSTQIHVSRDAFSCRPRTEKMTVPTRFGLPIHGHAHIQNDSPVPADRHRGKRREITVDSRTVDQVTHDRGINRIDFMKIDAEGREPAILAGAKEVLTRFRPTLLLEIESRHLNRYDSTPEELTDWLDELGYAMYSWNNYQWRRTPRVTRRNRNYLFSHIER